MHKYILILLMVLISYTGYARKYEPRTLQIKKANSEIVLDGVLDESDWEHADLATEFWQRFPYDTALAKMKTEVRVSYDDKNIYVGAICYHPKNTDYVVQSLRRDFDGSGNDAFYLVLNPFNDQMSGILFGTNPYGSQKEAIIQNGGAASSRHMSTTNSSWDNKWYVEIEQYEDRWVLEMAIPFKTLRFNTEMDHWRVNFCRVDYANNEYSNWNHIPKNFSFSSLANTGLIRWDEAPSSPGSNISIIPFASAGLAKDYENNTAASFNPGIGGDAKIAMSSSMNLDLTINPDFSQVEVDEQVTNLDRFEIYYPEKRQFFLENNDIFSEFGDNTVRPFFSRRIGIAYDEKEDEYVETPIILGARLSGKLNQDWKLGLLNMQTAQVSESMSPSTNYTVATIHRRVFERSSLAAFMTNKSPVGLLSRDCDSCNYSSYNRVAGMDFSIASPDNFWTGKVFYHHSFDEIKLKNTFAHGTKIAFDNGVVKMSWDHQLVGDNFNAEVGYVRRTGYFSTNPLIGYTFYPKGNSIIVSHGPEMELINLRSNDYGLADREFTIRYQVRFRNQSSAYLSYNNVFVKLTSDYDPSRTDGMELATGTEYNTWYLYSYYKSDQRKAFTYGYKANLGSYFLGYNYTVSANTAYQFRPFGYLAMEVTRSQIDQPAPYNSAVHWLAGPRLEITFARNLYFATLVQYNTQRENLNINARLQWRYAPVSDFYIVYTDNYLLESFNSKNRALIFKLTYWLNV